VSNPVSSVAGIRGINRAVARLVACACAAGAWMPVAMAAEPRAGDDVLDEITVTGTRIRQDGVTAPTPVTVVDAARIQDLAATNLGNVLNSLPSFRPSANLQTSNIQPRGAGTIQADLRGLAPVRTLVLVNDRRFIPSTQEGTIDLNQIPTMLVERTEVVTGGASAQYGSDAVAGVVNIFTKTRMQGVTAELQYGLTEENDGKNLRAGVAGGTAFGGDRGHVVGAIEYEDNRGVGNCYERDWCAEEWQVITNTGSATPGAPGAKLIGYPANNILPQARTVNAVQGGTDPEWPAARDGIQSGRNAAAVPVRAGVSEQSDVHAGR
jgi:outer membrane receptor protein involved in Fe transport